MMSLRPRRKLDWSTLEGADPSRVRLVLPSSQTSGLTEITSALFSDPSAKTVDHVLRQSVEFARTAIGLERTAIFLVGPGEQSMIGTWGTDMRGQTVDEHDVSFDIDDITHQFFARSSQGSAWSLYENCPFVTHEGGRARALNRGWVACTAIQGRGQPIGVLFNDTAITGAPVDESKQSGAALLCSLLGRALETCRDHLVGSEVGTEQPKHPLVRRAAQLLVREPAQSFEELAKRLGVSKKHMTRTFKLHAATSIVEYRNELRLAQFLSQVGNRTLLDAALGAGFGCYAQFHRVFRARFGKTPREYLFEHRAAPRRKSKSA
jgi:AraC-like DNA-binding protein